MTDWKNKNLFLAIKKAGFKKTLADGREIIAADALSRAMGISKAAIYLHLLDERNMNSKTIRLYMRVLKCSADDILAVDDMPVA